MAKVALDFIPPDEPDIAALLIYEGGTSAGPFVQIERVTSIGAYPDYITRYTSNNATSAIDWFTIAWENTDGFVGDMSASIKGGTQTVVQKIIDRVRDRDSTLSERVVAQEAEAAVQSVLGDNVDPYDPDLVLSYRQLNGLVYLVMARAYIVAAVTASSGAVESATLGLVSFRSESSSASKKTVDVQKLIDLANRYLGISTSFVLQLQEIQDDPVYHTYDHSRLTSGWISIDS